ncbi:hypothetical protein [Actinomycetospora straminea]|uniref:Serine hydrolase n=1 Tax=Actinomycetospora straminea TaxID=663607 RepID=A0ABP9FC36_9PSEU|nr:hypothetical protein [Actinomycetospora straminea]MDD7936179.1 hypothetical protein [Actinomycetospora straminea]
MIGAASGTTVPAATTGGANVPVGRSATVVVVLSLQPDDTSYDEAARRLDDATRTALGYRP